MNSTVALMGWGEKIGDKAPVLILYKNGKKFFRLMSLPSVNRVADARFKNHFTWYRHVNVPISDEHVLSIGMYKNPNVTHSGQ